MHRLAECAFVVLVLSPLIAWPGFREDSVRLVAVTAAAGAIVWRVAWSVARRRERGIGLHPLMVAATGFLLFRALGLIGSVNPWEGLAPLIATAAAVAACGALCAGYFPRAFLFRWGLPAFSACALLVGAWGILQFAGGDAAGSTLGNTNRSGAVAAILAPVCGGLAFVGRDWRRWLAAAGWAASLALVALSDSRGAFLAAAAGAVTMGLLMPWRRVAVAAVGAILVVAALKHERVAAILSRDVRLEIWPGALKVAGDFPVLGCGAGNFRSAYPPYRSAAEFMHHDRNPAAFHEVEDAHNLYLQLLSEGGVLSLLAFLWGVYVSARLCRYHLRHAPDTDFRAAYAGLAGGGAAFLVAGLTAGLDRFAAPWLLFWLILGTIEALGMERSHRRARPAGEAAVGLAVVGGVLSVFAVYFATVLAAADWWFLSARQGGAIENLQRSAEIFHPRWDVHAHLGRELAVAGRHPDAQVHLERALALHPTSVWTLNQLARVVAVRNRLDEAKVHLTKAIELAPFYWMSYYNRAVVSEGLGDRAAVRADAAAILALADAYYRSDRKDEAARLCGKAVDLDVSLRDDPVARKILGRQ